MLPTAGCGGGGRGGGHGGSGHGGGNGFRRCQIDFFLDFNVSTQTVFVEVLHTMAKFLNSLSSLRPFLDDAAKPFLQNNQAYLNAGQSILGGASAIEPMLDEDVNVGNQSTTSGLGMGSACPRWDGQRCHGPRKHQCQKSVWCVKSGDHRSV